MLMRELKEVKLNRDFPLQISTCCTSCESHHKEKRCLEDLNHNTLPLSSTHQIQFQDLFSPILMVPSKNLEKQFFGVN